MASNGGPDLDTSHLWKNDSIEERIFSAALICLEGHYNQAPVMGQQSMAKVTSIVSKTLEKTHTLKDVRSVTQRQPYRGQESVKTDQHAGNSCHETCGYGYGCVVLCVRQYVT
jgi:hypothetical protein